jgi:hypothetical protein
MVALLVKFINAQHLGSVVTATNDQSTLSLVNGNLVAHLVKPLSAKSITRINKALPSFQAFTYVCNVSTQFLIEAAGNTITVSLIVAAMQWHATRLMKSLYSTSGPPSWGITAPFIKPNPTMALSWTNGTVRLTMSSSFVNLS